MTATYRVIHDPHAIPLLGVRFTRKQIERAVRRGDLISGTTFALGNQRILLTKHGLLATGLELRREER